MRCASCGLENPGDARFCEQCGAQLAATCPSCGHQPGPDARFCSQCGHTLEPQNKAGQPLSDQVPEATPASGPDRLVPMVSGKRRQHSDQQQGERKTITALFADMANSTALINNLDPEDAGRLIDPVLASMMEAVHHYGGYVAKSMGDGILALFGAPVACEDHPQRALYAALRMQETLSRHEASAGRLPKVRVGIHTGEVMVRTIAIDDLRSGCEPVGNAIHIASRLEGLAEPGTILVSEPTFRLTDGYVDFKPLGARTLKGVAEPVNVYKAVSAAPLRTRLQVAARRGLVRFVGRKTELGMLHRALVRVQQGQGQVVSVAGDPGVGKSRLFLEFKQRLPDAFDVLETFSVSHGKAFAYMPLIELLKQCFRLGAREGGAAWRRRIATKVLSLGEDLRDCLPYLYHVLGVGEASSSLDSMDVQIRHQRVFDAIRRLLIRLSLHRPLVLIFEDLQWLDKETEAFIRLLAEDIGSTQLLLLLNFRPEYPHDWLRALVSAPLRLEALDGEDTEELLNVLLGSDAGLSALKNTILNTTEGNPFFTEEVIQTLVEEGVLNGERGHFSLGHRPSTLHIPTTVQGVLNARIDRLSHDEKRLLQTLTVIGKQFAWSLALAVADQPEDRLRELLSRLQAREYLFECPAFPEIEYSFKHGLTQQVAYDSLLHARRSLLHERIAQAIERRFAPQLEDHYAELAHHYSRSENAAKAVEYLRRAGQRAVQHCANIEAIGLLEAALQRLPQLPKEADRLYQELALQLTLGLAWMAVRGYGAVEVETSYSRALELCRRAGSTPQHFTALMGLNAFYLVRGRLRDARVMGEQLLVLADALQDPVFHMHAHRTLGIILFFLGDFATARSHLERALSLFDPHQQYGTAVPFGMDTGTLVLPFLALDLAFLGYPDQAMQRLDEALGQNLVLSQPLSMVFALGFAAQLHLQRGEAVLSQERAQAAISLAGEQGFPFWSAWATVLKGQALIDRGLVDEGILSLRQGLADYRATGAELWQMHFLVLLADSLGRTGEVGPARSVLAQARKSRTQERFYLAELYRLQGGLTLAGSDQEPAPGAVQRKAEHCFRRAMDVARIQGARLLELRAACDLGCLWLQQGRKDETRALLTALSDLYTESFDTADFMAARALVERCGGLSSGPDA